MRQHFIFLQIFLARRMYAFPSSSMLMTLCAPLSAEYHPVWALYSRSSNQCRLMFLSRLWMYAWLHPGSLLLSLLPAGRTILTGFSPTRDSIGMSSINARWLPIP